MSGLLAAILDQTWPAFSKRPRPRYLPAGMLVGLCGLRSLVQFQYNWMPLHIHDRNAVAAVLSKRFRTEDTTQAVQE